MSSGPSITYPETASSDETLADLAQILAHRLRSLVASIEGFTDLLADTLSTREQRELALRILEGAARIEKVLADLQQYGQPLDPAALPIDVRDAMAGVLTPLADADRDRLDADLGAMPNARFVADPFLFQQAVLIMIQNALDATASTGGRLRLTARTDRPWVHFDVWNEGHIPLEDAEQRVFLPFFTTKAQNLGVGLTLVRRIASQLAGRVALTDNSPDTGVCFTLSLPLAGEQAFDEAA